MLPTQLTQPTLYSCVTTCIAMLLGKESPDDIVAKYHPLFWSGKMTTHQILDDLQIKYRKPRNPHCLKRNKTYLIGIPSLNITGGMHQVIFQVDNNWTITVFDPAQGRKGRRFYQSTWKPLTENSVYPITWFIDAEIIGIKRVKVSNDDVVYHSNAYQERQRAASRSHDYDFHEFLMKRVEEQEQSYDLAP